MAEIEDKYLDIFVGRLKKYFGVHLQKIILFGSRARGDHSKDSDYDLVLIFDRVTSQDKEFINDLEGEMLYEYSVVFSAFPFTNEDLAGKRFEPFIMNAQREGIEL